MAANRALDAVKQADSSYEADDREAALINYLLRGGPVQPVPPINNNNIQYNVAGQNVGGGRTNQKI